VTRPLRRVEEKGNRPLNRGEGEAWTLPTAIRRNEKRQGLRPCLLFIEKEKNGFRFQVLGFKQALRVVLRFKRRKNEISNEDCRGSPSLAMTFFSYLKLKT
jgi:hypothetical protein